MESSIIAVATYSFLLLAAFLTLKSTLKNIERKRLLTAELRKERASHIQSYQLENQGNISFTRCFALKYLFLNFTVFNLCAKKMTNRTQTLIFTYAIASVYVHFFDCWLAASSFGTVFALSIFLYEIIESSQTQQESDKEAGDLKLKWLCKSQIGSCIGGIIAIGSCILMISLTYSNFGKDVKMELIFWSLVIMIDNGVFKPIVFVLMSLTVVRFKPVQLSIRYQYQKYLFSNNKLNNQFYRTSQSEAQLNDTLALHRQINFQTKDEPGKEDLYKKQLKVMTEPGGDHINFKQGGQQIIKNVIKILPRSNQYDLENRAANGSNKGPEKEHKSKQLENKLSNKGEEKLNRRNKWAEREFQRQKDGGSSKQSNKKWRAGEISTTEGWLLQTKQTKQDQNQMVQREITKKDQRPKNQNETIENGQQLNHCYGLKVQQPAFFKEKAAIEENRYGKRRTRQKKHSYREQQIAQMKQIYGSQSAKKSVSGSLNKRKTSTILNSKAGVNRSSQQFARSRPIVHEQSDQSICPKIKISHFYAVSN